MVDGSLCTSVWTSVKIGHVALHAALARNPHVSDAIDAMLGVFIVAAAGYNAPVDVLSRRVAVSTVANQPRWFGQHVSEQVCGAVSCSLFACACMHACMIVIGRRLVGVDVHEATSLDAKEVDSMISLRREATGTGMPPDGACMQQPRCGNASCEGHEEVGRSMQKRKRNKHA